MFGPDIDLVSHNLQMLLAFVLIVLNLIVLVICEMNLHYQKFVGSPLFTQLSKYESVQELKSKP